MPESGSQKFTLGFVFDNTLHYVLLVHKERPEWQKGRLNGVGGKYKLGETPSQCIARETREEAALLIPADRWLYVGTIQQFAGDVGVLACIYQGARSDARMNDHEKVEWFQINQLPDVVIENVRWLIPLSLEKVQGNVGMFVVRY